MSRPTSTNARRLARLLIGTAVTGAVSLGVAGTASAEGAEQAPPAASWAAPAESGIPAVGDAGQDYWASDGCHYFAQGGTWYSDMCTSQILDAAGNVVPNVISDFQNLGGGQLGRELLRMDFTTPGHVIFAPVTDVVGTPITLPLSSPTPGQVLGTTIGGTPQWVTVITPPTAGPATGFDHDYDMSAKGQQLRALENLASQTNTIMVNNAMGNPSWALNP